MCYSAIQVTRCTCIPKNLATGSVDCIRGSCVSFSLYRFSSSAFCSDESTWQRFLQGTGKNFTHYTHIIDIPQKKAQAIVYSKYRWRSSVSFLVYCYELNIMSLLHLFNKKCCRMSVLKVISLSVGGERTGWIGLPIESVRPESLRRGNKIMSIATCFRREVYLGRTTRNAICPCRRFHLFALCRLVL